MFCFHLWCFSLSYIALNKLFNFLLKKHTICINSKDRVNKNSPCPEAYRLGEETKKLISYNVINTIIKSNMGTIKGHERDF